MGSWIDQGEYDRILDIGTGSGILALMAAQRFENSEIVGIEIDEKTALTALDNTQSSPFADRIQIIHEDIMNIKEEGEFDLIISNPPFFESNLQSPIKRRNQARHGVTLDLKSLLLFAKRHLSAKGTFALILPFNRKHQLHQLTNDLDLNVKRLCSVSSFKGSQPIRILMEITKDVTSIVNSESLFLYDHQNIRSQKFQELSKDFYLDI